MSWRRLLKHTWPGRCILVSAAMVLLVACSSSLRDRDGTVAANQQLAARIKAAMVSDPRVNGSAIDVRVDDDVVMLEGFAETSAARDAAEATARRFIGERSLTVQLEVK